MPRTSLCFVLLTLLAADCCAARRPDSPPNLVLIFIDDMGYGDIGPYGSALNRTPNLSRMAAEGMKLTSFYAAPVCSASRAQLLTGCYAPRVSVPGVFFPAGSKGLNPAETTVAEYLRELGYATACFGKWHLGDQKEFLPTRQGFDQYFGIPYSNDMQRNSLEDSRRVVPLLRDETVAELLEDEGQRRVTREYTQEAVKFIESHKSSPFFLYLPHTAVHVPLFPHPDFVGKSQNGTYGDWVEEVDWSVGEILNALRRSRLDQNTLVLFTSDNGPWVSRGSSGGVAGPLRGSKGCTLEGGVREPTIVWWPGQIEPGSVCDAVAGTIDVLPTFVALAGGQVRQDVTIDGRDISPLLRGDTVQSPHEAWYYYQGTRLQAVRKGPWKLAITPQTLGMGIKEKPADISAPGMRLYNLDREIGEMTNVADQHPEIVAELTVLADAMIADIGSGKPGPGVRPAGTVENPVTLYPTQPKKAARISGKPIDWSKVQQGEVINSKSMASIAGQPIKITCTIDVEKPEGVIIAHGGAAIGYALYAREGEVVFAARHSADRIVRIAAPLPAHGPVKIDAELASDGQIHLRLNDANEVTGETGQLFAKHPQEDFCVGHDNRNLLDERAPQGQFKGKISGVKVVIGS